ncbi:MAG: hypothetical protein ACRDAW_00835 [Metamycoplasmataceae bacterium]
MNKKLLVSLSSLSTIAIVAPVLVITSCAGNTAVEVKDLTITAITTPKLTQQDVTALKGTASPAQLVALKKLFGGSGVSQANQANFKVSVNETGKIVTLTANTGFTINTKPSFASNQYTVEETPVKDLNITATANVVLTEADVTTLSGTDTNAQWLVLEKLFGGPDFTSANKDKFIYTFDKTNSTVTLTAATGYSIGGKQTLLNTFTIDKPSVNTNLIITAKSSPTLTQAEETTLKGTGNNTTKWDVLAKFFTGAGFIPDNKDKFSVSVGADNKVTLKAIQGYTINDKDTFVSNAYTVSTTPPAVTELKIAAIKNDVTLTMVEVDALSDKSASAAVKLAVLVKLFEGTDLKVDNLNKFDVLVDNAKTTVTLTTKTNYTFAGATPNNKLNKTYKLAPTTTELQITAQTAAATLSATEVTALTGSDVTAKLNSLKKLFTGGDLTNTNLNKFKVGVNTGNRIVTLTAEANFTFAKGDKTLDSKPYINAPTGQDLDITAKSASVALTGQELIDVVGTDLGKSLLVLNKLFDKVNSTKQANFTVSLGSGSVVTLTAKIGYTFNGKPSINSSSYTVTNTNLNITANTEQTLNSFEDERINTAPDQTNAAGQLAILKKLFNGITDANANNFTFTIANKVVTLKAKTGFAFGAPTATGTNTVVALAYKVNTDTANLNIKAITPKGEITADDYGVLFYGASGGLPARLTILSKLFSGITIENITRFNYLVQENDKTIRLTGKDGYFFGEGSSAQKMITSQKYTEKITPITVVPTAISATEIQITSAELTIIESNTATAKQKFDVLKKLFNGLTEDMISKQVSITVTKTGTTGTVTISPRLGYNFANNASPVIAKYKTT